MTFPFRQLNIQLRFDRNVPLFSVFSVIHSEIFFQPAQTIKCVILYISANRLYEQWTYTCFNDSDDNLICLICHFQIQCLTF